MTAETTLLVGVQIYHKLKSRLAPTSVITQRPNYNKVVKMYGELIEVLGPKGEL